MTRRTLSPAQQAVQSCHAALDFSCLYKDVTFEWNKTSNYLVQLAVEDEEALQTLIARLAFTGLKFIEFREPDIDNALTAICIEPSPITRKLTSSIPKMLKNVQEHESI